VIELSTRLEELSPQKRELLLRQLRQLPREAPRPVIRPRQESLGDFPLSYAQQRLWFLDQLEPGNPFYNVPGAFRLAGNLDEAALASALSEIIRRHEILRTTFPAVGGKPVQRIGPPAPAPLPVVDLAELPAGERQAAVRALLAAEVRRPCDLAAGPLLRFLLLRLGSAERVLAFTFHHIVSDGWSMRILVRELAALYPAACQGALSPLPELPVQYADCAAAERRWLDGDALDSQLAYWKGRLADLPSPLELPADRPRPEVLTFRGARQGVALSPATFAALKSLGQGERATPFMTLLAGFVALLHRYTGRDDLLVGTPIANRDRVETEGLIGFFVNTLVLRGDLHGDPGFRHLVARIRETALEAFAHPDLPFERLVEELQPERDLAHTPVFQVLFAFQSIPVDASPPAGLRLEALPLEAGKALFDLSLTLEEMNGRVAGFFEYNTDLFDALRMRRLAAHFEALLGSAVGDPARALSALSLLTAVERQQALVEWNDTAVAREETPALIHEPFEAWARRTPGAVAAVWRGEALTYGDLEEQANLLAHRLACLGAGPGSLIGIHLRRGPGLIVAVLAVLKAGAAYVPLEIGHPPARLRSMLEILEISVLITETAQRDSLPALPHVICLDQPAPADSSGPVRPVLARRASPDDLAYIIFTSGSTGAPKGVMVRHRPVMNLLHWAYRAFAFSPVDRVLFVTALSFDLSVFDIFGLLGAGGSIRIADEEEIRDPERLLRALAGEPITFWDSAPAALEQTVPFLPGMDGQAPPPLRLVFLSGDWIPVTLPDRIRERFPQARVVALGGATEATVWSNVFRVERVGPSWTSIPYGRPTENARYHVLDGGLAPCPVGVPGDLYIGGDCLADGYAREPVLTAYKFLPDPWSAVPGARLYRTGDRARYWPDGNLEFLGRLDHQVKIRGFRIELGEIEAALASLPGVREAVVAVHEERTERGSRDRRLVAYVAGDAAADTLGHSLREQLRERLPEYMVPAAFVTLAALPLTANGKVDRRALAALRPQAAAAPGWTPPRTPAEEILAGLWEEVLRARGVGAHDNFFDLGGHSLLATQVVSRLRETFAVELPLRALFEAPTVAGLAARIEAARAAGSGPAAPPIARVPRDGRLPLSFGQLRLWFLDQLEPGSAAYNLPWAVRLEGGLDAAALAAVLSEIARRHEALRTIFHLPEGDDEPAQRILPAAPVPLPLIDLAGLPAAARAAEARRLGRIEARRPFDLAPGPLLRAALLRLAGEEHALLLTLHHIVSDGWSMGVLTREVAALYAAAVAAHPSPLPDLQVQYADYAAWQRGWLVGAVLAAQLTYWRRALAAAPPLLDLPTDRPRPPLQTFHGDRRALFLPSELAEGVRRLGRGQGATAFMVLLAALQTLLHRISGQPVVAVGSPIANRGRSELEGLIGFFANTLVLAVDLAGEPSFSALLDRVREAALGAYAHQDLPFEKLVEELAPERNLAHAPLFQVLLAYQSAVGAALPPAAGGLTVSALDADMAAAKFDLSLNVEERGGGLATALEYNTDLFDPATAGRLLEQFRDLLAAALAAPEARVSELPLLAGSQRAQLLVEWNDTAPPAPAWDCLHELFIEQARRAPEDPAVIAPEGTLTRGELAERAGRLAAHLRRLGVGPEVLVGICMERTLDMVVAMLGTLAAGGAYLPLDPAYPRERLDFMLADAAVPVVLTQERTLGRLGVGEGQAGPRWICLDRDWPAIAAAPSAPPSAVRPDHLAYVIYTSGSTGLPKGVALAHRSAVALLRWASGIYPESDRGGVLGSTSICFDLSVFELFLPLCFGGTVILAENALQLPHLADASKVSLVNTVPSAIAELVRGEGLPPSVCTIVLAGEPLPRKLVGELYAVETVERVMNLYGPSEDTTYSTFATIERSGGLPPIGRPVEEGRIYLLDAHLQPVPIGVPGEMLLGGAGLARCYLNRPELTAEKFVPDPFSGEPGARLYRTGDLARFRPDGEMLFLGRVDHQVKLRGFRIELGEIEATLRLHPGVAEALLVAKGEPGTGDLRLIAYVVGKGEAPPAVEDLRGFLRAKLPAHMVPWAFVPLAAFPLNANGKIDRKALPDPERAAWGAPVEAAEPRSEMEHRIAAIWQELLRLERVGIHDNFFDSGGHSLLAVRIYHRLKRELGRELPLVALFEHPTIGALARFLEAGEAAPASRQRGQDRGARRREAAGARRRPSRPAAGAATDDETQEL
jgi:amino acid adenylation domain-containing protein